MSQSAVAVLRTRPETIFEDYARLLELARANEVLDPALETALKINISWHFFYPACSTTPWQLEGVIRGLRAQGFSTERLHACHNRTVVVDARLGERENKHLPVVEKYGLRNVHLYDEGEEWIHVRDAVGDLADEFLVLNEVYPDGFLIPKRFPGENIVHLPTVKTHVFTTSTGAMKNAFGGLLNERRHLTHPVIHQTLVDLLMIQKRIHPGVLAVMDGTFAGDGPGPRCMVPHCKNVLLASDDQVAIDAVSAAMMGFDPLSIDYIRLAHERGLGCGDVSKIEIVGDGDAAAERWGFEGPYREMTFASRMQHKIYWGPLRKPLEWSLKTFLAPWAYLASILYHDSFWYPLFGRSQMQEALESDWGRLFQNWEHLTPDERGFPSVDGPPGRIVRSGWAAFRESIRLLGMSVREAPELASRRRRRQLRSRASRP